MLIVKARKNLGRIVHFENCFLAVSWWLFIRNGVSHINTAWLKWMGGIDDGDSKYHNATAR